MTVRALAILATLAPVAASPAYAQPEPDAGALDAERPEPAAPGAEARDAERPEPAGPGAEARDAERPEPAAPDTAGPSDNAGGPAGPAITEPEPSWAGGPSSTTTGPRSALPSNVKPPIQWKEWTIEGRLVDPRDVVRGFLEPVMEQNRNWRDRDQRNVIEFLQEIGYHAVVRNELLDDGGVRAVLNLEPITRVRRVSMEFAEVWEQVKQPVFKEDIVRRMRLRPGAALALDRTSRSRQLRDEEERIADYLRNDGFFEARVRISEKPAGPHAVALHVAIDKGPAYRIGDIDVTGNVTLSADAITANFRHSRFCILQVCVGNQRFSRQQLNSDVESVVAMYQQRGFAGVRVRTDFDLRHSFKRNTNTVEFTVVVNERRKIDVVFEGNSRKFPHAELESVLTFRAESAYDDVTVEQSADEIRRYYQSEGYFEAAVTWERERFEFFDRVIFMIDEGPKLKVREVTFSGHEAVTEEELREAVRTARYQAFAVFQEGGYATSVQIEQDVGRILEIYRSRGYHNANVRVSVARQAALLDSPAALTAAALAETEAEGLYVRFEIDEGSRVAIERVTFSFESSPAIDTSQLRALLAEGPRDPFVPQRIEADRKKLERYYFEHGFPRAEVETFSRPVSGGAAMEITHSIREHARKRVGKIAIRGNFKTRDWIIREELKLEEGQLLTAEAAQIAQSNLRSSGLFSGVQLRYFGVDDSRRETVNVIVRVEERHDNTAAIELGGGWSTDSSFFTEIAAKMENIAGIGARLDTKLQLGLEIRSAEAKLVFPRWLTNRTTGSSFLLEIAGFWREETTERFGELTSFGGSVAATKEWRRGFFQGWLLSLRYDFRQRNRDEELVRPPGASGDLTKVPVTTRTSGVGPQLIIDKRRDEDGRLNPLAPARGYRIDLRALFAEDRFLGSDRFLKFGGSLQHYLTVAERLKLSNGIRYDHGVPLGDDVLLPEVERFFAGGDTTVRGFEEDRLAIEVIEDEVPPLGVRQFRVLPASGNIRFIHKADLQLRVWSLGGFPVATAVFLDTGLVTNSLDGFEVTDLRHALGVALFRYVTPFGSASIEWAVPLDPQLGDDPRGRFHINLGATLQF